MTGRLGDVVLLHPYVLHAVSQNHLGVARFITNPPIALKEPMNFNRDNPNEFSPVERAVLKGLGVERLDFTPTAPRENVVPERVPATGKNAARRTAAISDCPLTQMLLTQMLLTQMLLTQMLLTQMLLTQMLLTQMLLTQMLLTQMLSRTENKI